ncbi:MAG: histidinol dehydrogenase [Candidatus Bipolaricaulota bacterium]
MELEKYVADVLEDIRRRGLPAVKEYSEKFDSYRGELLVSEEELAEGVSSVPREDRQILEKVIDRVRELHQGQVESDALQNRRGSLYGLVTRPLQRVGLYVPGGRPLPSSLIMSAVPARLAGVEELVVASPPTKGKLDPYLLFVAQALQVEEVVKLGGIQAIGALAYGCGIEKVQKIVGPGNQYVNEAKRQVFGEVGIGRLAGPSDVCVIADGTAPKRYVRKDLLSQLEHGEGSRAWLLTTSRDLADHCQGVGAEVQLCSDLASCVERANRIAPEHLEILTESPSSLLEEVQNAGAVYLGINTPVAAGDYSLGVNHVLPTGGSARFDSVLTVRDFQKVISVAQIDEEEYPEVGRLGIKMAEIEGMKAHKQSLEVRFDEEKDQ